MDANKRVEALEGEFKLIKGELKQTLASVRDYLLSLKLPPPGDVALLNAIDGEDKQTIVMSGALDHSSDVSYTQPTATPVTGGAGASPAAGEVVDSPAAGARGTPAAESSPGSPAYQPVVPGESVATEAGLLESPEGYVGLEGVGRTRNEDMLERHGRRTGGEFIEEVDQSTPRVNLLSNLIRWVANAKKEVGAEQLTTFLEVYGISGHLSPELKEIILHLVEITEPGSADASAADIWSRLILELHGILTGGDAPLHIVKPLWADDEGGAETGDKPEEKPGDKPLKLKLMLTDGGTNREFSIDLNPEAGGESSLRRPSTTSDNK